MAGAPKSRLVDEGDLSSINNICLVAAECFEEHASMWRRQGVQDMPPESVLTLLPSGPTAMRLAEQFDRQAAEARTFAGLFASTEPFTMTLDEE